MLQIARFPGAAVSADKCQTSLPSSTVHARGGTVLFDEAEKRAFADFAVRLRR